MSNLENKQRALGRLTNEELAKIAGSVIDKWRAERGWSDEKFMAKLQDALDEPPTQQQVESFRNGKIPEGMNCAVFVATSMQLLGNKKPKMATRYTDSMLNLINCHNLYKATL